MPTLKVRIQGGKVKHHAEGFTGKSCQEVGEAYLNRFGLGVSDVEEEPREVEEEIEVSED